jgi:uncharacterized membrane protein YgdD (TMEM256/DUF423 family)
MNSQTRIWLTLAALSGLIAVGFGAFGVHGVSDPRVKDLLHTAVEYQMFHSLAVFACFSLYRAGARAAGIAAWLFLTGVLLFSGSIYGLALTPLRWFWPATPIGGLCFMAGWATLAWAAFAGTKDAQGGSDSG